MPERSYSCEACTGDLCRRGSGITGLCQRCREDGAEFARAWLEDLDTAGLPVQRAAEILGIAPATARVRLNERKRRRRAASTAVAAS